MQQKLFMVLIGATPAGRFTEQHDVFFGIAPTLKDLVPSMQRFWPDAALHIDAWREVTSADGHKIEVVPKKDAACDTKLFFINLGGYRLGDFEEYHYKVLGVGASMAEAVKKSKQTAFFKHCGFAGAASHIDDKYGVAVDDVYNVQDILPNDMKEAFGLQITVADDIAEDELHIGYVQLKKLIKSEK